MRNMGFVLFALAALLGQTYAALAVESYSVTPAVLKPGEEGAVTFAVKNAIPAGSASTAQLENVQVYFGGTVAGVEFKAQSPFIIGTIESGGSALVSIPFRVLPNAKGGAITVPFFISQKDKPDLKTVNAIIKVVNPPIITLSSDKSTLLSTDTINLTITNNGGRADRVTIKLAEGSRFSLSGVSQIYVGEVVSQKSVLVPIDARNVEEGVNSIPFLLSYQQEGGAEASELKPFAVTVRKEKSDIVFAQAGKLVASQSGVLSLKVKNTGRQNLEDLQIYLEDSKIRPSESRQIKIGNLLPGEEKLAEYRVFVDTAPGTQSTTLRLKWFENDVEKEEVASVPVVVASDADVAVFVDAKPSPIVSGGEHAISITVSNIGSYRIQNVEAEIGQSEVFEIMNAQRSQYIGGLDADDFSSVQYKVKVKASPGIYPLPIKVRYKDQSGIWIDKEQDIQISVRSQEEAGGKGGNGSLPLIAAGALALLAAGYWYFRMRKSGRAGKKEA
ncbi:MAG: hypothetical protein N3F07_02490 [Candidatus Micrarchaeota archaeon]|nr:hypothetical protein [Candidatus Micrarchaeota archaeon]